VIRLIHFIMIEGFLMRTLYRAVLFLLMVISVLPVAAQDTSVEEVDVDGKIHILRTSGSRQIVSPLVKEALSLATSYYNQLWGALELTLFVDLVAEQGPATESGARPDAETNYHDSLEVPQVGGGSLAMAKVCEVRIYNIDAEMAPEEVRFITAHEIAHCFHEQFMGSLDVAEYTLSTWWVEGTANWMASLIYPPTSAPVFWGSANRSFLSNMGVQSMLATSYDNSFFFMALARTRGIEATMDFIKAIPKSPLNHESYIREHFGDEEFSLLMSNYGLMVGQGALRGLPPDSDLWSRHAAAVPLPSAGHTMTTSRLSFNLYAYTLTGLPAGESVDVIMTIPQGINARARLLDGTEVTNLTPVRVCPTDGAVRVIISRGFGDVGGDFEIAFNPTSEPCVPTAASTTGTPSCLLGNWTLLQMPGIPTTEPERSQYRMWPGNSGLTFSPGGHVEMRFDGLRVRNVGPMKEYIFMRMYNVVVRGVANFNAGTDAGRYTAAFLSGEKIGRASMLVDVFVPQTRQIVTTDISSTVEQAFNVNWGAANAGTFIFRCAGDRLEYTVQVGTTQVLYLYSR
jgi:hypothetical protein